MYTPRLNHNPVFTKYLVGHGVIHAEPFSLADVGASGGIDQFWQSFQPDLRAFGFDPLVKEVARLNSAEPQNSGVNFFPYRVGSRDYGRFLPEEAWHANRNNQSFTRVSCLRALKILNCNYQQVYNDPAGDGAMAAEKIDLDEFFLSSHPHNVDFIKIDTDGFDYEVLLGARELIRKSSVLGLAIECQFHGLLHEHANLFSNIDRLARGHGFSLFDIEVQRYSRACLPAQFSYRLPACTVTGQVIWGDAFYFRDVAADNYEQDLGICFSVEKLLKLACLFEIFGFADCSAEILLKFRGRLQDVVNIDACLDLLTPLLKGRKLPYQQYTKKFEEELELFYPPANPGS